MRKQLIGKTNVCLGMQDCLSGMSEMEAQSVDVVVTSPPYNLGIEYGTYEDRQTKDSYLDWVEQWGEQVRRVLSDNGSFFLNVGGSPSNPLLPHEILIRLSKYFVLQNSIHWIKSITIQNPEGVEISAGHFKPINSKRYLNDCHEYVFHFSKTGATPIDRLSVGVEYADKSNIRRWAHSEGKDKRCRGNNWYMPYKTIQSRDRERPHPATFPVELPVMCLKLHGLHAAQTVMDPFVGIGSSAIAAVRCGVTKFVGFDLDAEYINTAWSRLFDDTLGLNMPTTNDRQVGSPPALDDHLFQVP